uniref:Uncharacterized protein n=1 Tax=Zea mays TaxID=4577 RepID=A0A804R1U9_MAIZE
MLLKLNLLLQLHKCLAAFFFLFLVELHWLEREPLGANGVVHQVHDLQYRDDPVKVIQLAVIDVVRQPVGAAGPRAPAVHSVHQQRARVASQRDGQPEERRRRAAHALGRLVVHELEVPHGGERLGHAVQRVLRHQPVGRQRGRAGVRGAGRRRRVPAVPLHEAGDQGGEHADGEADAHAVQEGDAAVQPREAARHADERAVVDEEGEEHGQQPEDGHGPRGDLERGEARREAAVHGARLLQGEGVLRRRPRDHQDARRPDRTHADHRLELLHAVHGAQAPQVRDGGRRRLAGVRVRQRDQVAVGDDRRAVKEAANGVS